MRADPFIQGYGGIFPRRRRGFSLPLRTSLVGSDGRVATFARASKAWYEDSTGLIREVAAGVPRQRADLGTLIEEARTNYAIYSDAPTAGPWFFGADATAGYGLDGPSPVPAGRATRVVFAGSGGNRIVRSVLPEGTLTAGATYTYSIWLWAPVPIETRLFRNNQSSWSTAARGGAITVGPVPRRVSLTFAQAAGETKAYCGFGSRDDWTQPAGEVWFWQAQVEPGSFPTSPIFTAGTPLARAADVLSVATTGWPVGRGRVGAKVTPQTTALGTIVDAKDGTGANGWYWTGLGGGVLRFAEGAGGTNPASDSASGLVTPGVTGNFLSVFDSTGARQYLNGIDRTNTKAGQVMAAIGTTAKVGCVWWGGAQLNGWLSDLEVSDG